MKEKAVSRLLTDEYAERILVATQNRPCSVQEISDAYDIPIAACYRKIHELEDAGFLRCAEVVTTPKGKAMRLYRSELLRANLVYENGEFKVKFEFRGEGGETTEWISLCPSPTNPVPRTPDSQGP